MTEAERSQFTVSASEAACRRLKEIGRANPVQGLHAAIGMILGASHFLKHVYGPEMAEQSLIKAVDYVKAHD